MRVLIVSQYFWPEEFRINDLAADLSDRGHEVTVLTGWPNYPSGTVLPEFSAKPSSFRMYKGVRIIRVPVIPRGNGRPARLVGNYLSYAIAGTAAAIGMSVRWGRFDVILVYQTSPITAALPAIALGTLTRAPVVLWIQDLWPDTLRAVGAVRSAAILKGVSAMVRFVYQRCDRILIQSQAFMDRVRQDCSPNKSIEYFPNWADAISSETAARAPELDDFKECFNLMFAGNLGDAQDLPALVAAADFCRDIQNLRWLVVGDGRGADKMRAEVVARGLQDRVLFFGRQPSERMPEFFAGADGLVVSLRPDPIFSLTVPSKVQTYLATGLPLLGMLNGEGARIIMDSGAGFASPAGDPNALASNVRRLIHATAGERLAMGTAGKAYAQYQFSRDRLVDRLETGLAQLAMI